MTPKQLVLDLNKKTAFVGSCSCLFDLDIKIPYVSIQHSIYAKTRAIILSYTISIILVSYLNIFHSRDFFFQPNNMDFTISAHIIDRNIMGLPIEKNMDKPIYISWNFCLSHI